MITTLVENLSHLPTWLATILLAAVPIGELRVAIPVSTQVWLVHPLNAYGLALIGNFLPFFPLYYGLGWVRNASEKRIPWLTRFIDAQIERSRKRVQEKYARYGAFALFLFTAIPLPLTGLWTATLAAVALKVPVKYALYGVVSGIVVAGIIVSLLTVSADVFF